MYKGPHHARVEVFSRQLSFSFECGFLRTRFLFKICVLTFNQFYLSFTHKLVLSQLPLYLPNSQNFCQSQSHTLSFSLTNTPTHPPTLPSNTDSLFKSISLSLFRSFYLSTDSTMSFSLFLTNAQLLSCFTTYLTMATKFTSHLLLLFLFSTDYLLCLSSFSPIYRLSSSLSLLG